MPKAPSLLIQRLNKSKESGDGKKQFLRTLKWDAHVRFRNADVHFSQICKNHFCSDNSFHILNMDANIYLMKVDVYFEIKYECQNAVELHFNVLKFQELSVLLHIQRP